jgi:hypothetical protein
MSWNAPSDFDVDGSTQLFALKFRALSKGQLSNVLQFNSLITPALAFNQLSEEMNIQLGFRSQDGKLPRGEGIVVYQNQPNPFAEVTVIGFELPEAAPTTLTVYDLNSRVIFRKNMQGSKGYNSVELNTAQLGVTGVLFYQLDALGYTATKRMVVIR